MSDPAAMYTLFREMDTDNTGRVPAEQCISTLMAIDPRATDLPEEEARKRLDAVASQAGPHKKVSFDLFMEMSEVLDQSRSRSSESTGNANDANDVNDVNTTVPRSFLDMGDTLLRGPTAHDADGDTTMDATAFELANRAEWKVGDGEGGLEDAKVADIDSDFAEFGADDTPSRPSSSTPSAAAEPRGIFRRRLSAAKRDIHQRDETIAKLRAELKAKDKSIALLETRVNMLEPQLHEKDRFINSLLEAQRSSRTSTDSETQREAELRRKSEEASASLADEYAKLANQFRDTQAEVTRMQREMMAQQQRAPSDKESDASPTSPRRRRSSESRHRRNGSTGSNGSDSADAMLMEMESLLAERDQTIADMRHDNAHQETMINDLKENVKELNADLRQMDQIKFDLERSKAEASGAKESIANLNAELRSVNKEYKALSKRTARAEAMESSLRQQMNELQRQLSVERRENDDSNSRRLQQDERVDRLMDELAHAEAERTRAETRARELEAKIRRFDSELTKADAHCGTLDGELQAKAAALHSAETTIAQLRVELASKSAAADTLEQFLAEDGRRLTASQTKAEGGGGGSSNVNVNYSEQRALVEDLGEALASTRTLLAKAREDARISLHQRDHERAIHDAALAHAKETAAMEINHLAQLLDQAKTDLTKYQSVIEKVRSEQTNMDRYGRKEEVDNLEKQVAALTEQLAVAEAAKTAAETAAANAARPRSPLTPPRPATTGGNDVTYDLAGADDWVTRDEHQKVLDRAEALEIALAEANDEIEVLKEYIVTQGERLIQAEVRGMPLPGDDDRQKSLVKLVDGVVQVVSDGGVGGGQMGGQPQRNTMTTPDQPNGQAPTASNGVVDPGAYIGTWPVVVADNEDAQRHKLAHVQCWLAVSTGSLVLLDKKRLSQMVAWDFEHVDRFGKDGETLALEVSGTVNGLIVLRSGAAAVDEMFRAIDYASELN
eukprot:m.187301 g.187301  ORF g.187301 m.187301 type:complete len:961 (+) comp17031_c0_seq1:127-3009(+)